MGLARTMESALVVALAVTGCASQTFGRVVTEVTVADSDPRLLYVRSCELVANKRSADQVALGDCKRVGVRRSAIVPVPVADARVIAREGRLVTGFFEREGGGAIVTTCSIGKRDDKWALVDCAETPISTAPLAASPTGGQP